MLGAAVGACEQCVLAIERDGTDRSFDSVVVEFDAAIVDEAGQAFPARQGIANGVGELALLADQGQFCAQPQLKGIDQRPAFLLADVVALVGAAATDVFLDGVECSNMLQGLAGDRRWGGSSEFVEVAPRMRPAEREPDITTFGQLAIAGIAINLQDSFEALEMGD